MSCCKTDGDHSTNNDDRIIIESDSSNDGNSLSFQSTIKTNICLICNKNEHYVNKKNNICSACLPDSFSPQKSKNSADLKISDPKDKNPTILEFPAVSGISTVLELVPIDDESLTITDDKSVPEEKLVTLIVSGYFHVLISIYYYF